MSFDRRIYNFAAGPATLPEEVLQQASDELTKLAWSWYKRDGDQPSQQRVHGGL
jgi:hypothetical protein